MIQSKTFLVVAACASLILGGCVYVPAGYYAANRPRPHGPPPPPPPAPGPGHFEDGTPYYFHPNNSLGPGPRYPRARGRTLYLEDETEDPVMEDPSDEPEDDVADGGNTPSPAPSPPSEPPKAPEKVDPATVPAATRTSTPGRVKSPYPPHRELDVTGMRSGSMAKDPTTGKVFRIP